MSDFITEPDLAEKLEVSVDTIVEWRRRYGWPHVKIGRQVRYTEADVRAIAAQHHVATKRPDALPDQTSLSAARSA